MQRTRELLVFLLVGVVLVSLAAHSQVQAQRRGSSQSRDYVRKLFKWHSPAGRSNSAGSGRGLMKWMMMQNMFQTPAPQSNIIIIQPSQTTTATTSPTTPPTTTTTTTASRAAVPDVDADDDSDSDADDGNKVKAIADDEADVSSISVNDKVAIVNEAAVKEGGGILAASEHGATAAVNELNQRNGNYRNPTTRRHPSLKSRQKPQSKRRNANAKKKKKTKNRKNNNKNKTKKNKRKQAKKKPQQIQLNGNTSNNNNNNIAIGDTSSAVGAGEGAGSNRIVVPNSSFGAVINAFRQLQNYQHQQQQPAQSSQSKPQSAAHASRPLFNVFNS